jgi:2'-5' RNA ligase
MARTWSNTFATGWFPTGWKTGPEDVDKGERHGSAVLWIRAPEWVAERLDEIRPDGLCNAPEIPHITVLYYPGDSDEPVDTDALIPALRTALSGTGALDVKLSGTAWFYGGGCLVLTASVPGLESVRHHAIETAPPQDITYGMVPHLTLGYLPENGFITAPSDPEISWTVTELELVSDDRVVATIPL